MQSENFQVDQNIDTMCLPPSNTHRLLGVFNQFNAIFGHQGSG